MCTDRRKVAGTRVKWGERRENVFLCGRSGPTADQQVGVLGPMHGIRHETEDEHFSER